MNSENNTPFDLITKVISGEASAEEIQQLELWRAENPEHEKEFKTLSNILSEVPKDLPQFDTNEAWNKVNQEIENRVQPVNKLKAYIVSIAASVVIAIGFFFAQDSSSTTTYTAQVDGEKINLIDGSIITLKKGSVIEYDTKFKENERTIQLLGEAFFSVHRDTTRPFVVHTNTIDVRVLGTSFNVKESKGISEVIVNTGKVEVKAQKKPSEKIIITKGESVTWNPSKNKLEQPLVTNPMTTYYATKTLSFKETKLSEVVKILSIVYNKKVSLQCEELGNRHYNGDFKDIPLQEAVDQIAFIVDAIPQNNNGNFVLTHQSCD